MKEHLKRWVRFLINNVSYGMLTFIIHVHMVDGDSHIFLEKIYFEDIVLIVMATVRGFIRPV